LYRFGKVKVIEPWECFIKRLLAWTAEDMKK
jgi:hypothetical protein